MPTTTTAARPWMTLADVAQLAQVQRPVASVWRTRHPDFPAPVAERNGHPVFDPEQVGAWLRQTGRGNNPDALGDAVAFARGADRFPASTVTALLTLSALTGELLADHALSELAGLAAEADPDDRFLRREIAQLTDGAEGSGGAEALLAYADRLADAAYSPAGALRSVADRLVRHGDRTARQTAIGPELEALVTAIVRALTEALDLSPLTLVDASHGGTGLVQAAARGAGDDATVLLGDYDNPPMRHTRRMLRARGLLTQPCDTDGGLPVLDGRRLVVLQLPDGPRPGLTDRQVLREVGELSLRMSEQQWALVLAPASALTDRLRDGEAERERDDLLRAGRLRLALRLPPGLLPFRGRQRLGMWLLGPAHPEVPAGSRWAVVGDLSDVPLDAAVRDELVTDAVAALGDVSVVRGHAFRHARLVSAPGLVAARGDLVTPAPVGGGRTATTPAQAVLEVDRLRRPAGAPGVRVYPAGEGGPAQGSTTLGRALERRQVGLLAGHRIRERDLVAADPDSTAGVVVIGPEELVGETPWGARRIDRLALHGGYPSAQLTEPGDVVFCTSRRVCVRVDRRGGSVVRAPARILRIAQQGRDAGLVPDVLAADLARQPASAKAYRTWTIRLVPADQTASLVAASEQLARQRDELTRRLRALDDLQRAVIDGVAAGAALLDPLTNDGTIRDNALSDKGE